MAAVRAASASTAELNAVGDANSGEMSLNKIPGFGKSGTALMYSAIDIVISLAPSREDVMG